jgi:hypothetical protein
MTGRPRLRPAGRFSRGKEDELRVLLALAALAATAAAQPMSGTYPVGPGGPGVDSFPTVQAAAAALSARGLGGDADFPIRQFVYTGPVTVTNVAGSATYKARFFASGIGAIIDGGGGRHGFLVENTDNVTVQGLRFRNCRDTGSAFLRFLSSDKGTVRSCRLEDSAQFGVQVIASDSFRAESLKFEGSLRAGDSRGIDWRDCRYAFASRCTMLGRVGDGLWIEGGSDNGNYRVTTVGATNHGLHIENSPRARIHNFGSRGSSQYGGFVLNSPFARLESCVFAGAARAAVHFERSESLYFDMGMGIGYASRAVSVVDCPYSEIMKLSVMASPAVGLYIKGSPECHVESTQYAGFFADTCVGIVIDSSDCTMFSWTQMAGRVGRAVSVRKSSDVKFRHARFDLTAAEAGFHLEQADRFAVRPCTLRLAGPDAAVLVADSSVDDSFQRLTIIGSPRNGVVARAARRLVLANSFVRGWSGEGVRLEGARSSELYYNTIVGAGSGVRLVDAQDVRARDNIIVNRGGDSAACWQVDGAWPFRPGGVDYNDLLADGSGAVGRVDGALYRALADWQARAEQPDPHSIAADPLFVSDTDHHITAGSPCRGAGTPVPGFEFDIDLDERDPVSPDIGADEYVPPAVADRPARPTLIRLRLERNPVAGEAVLRYSLPAAARVRFTVSDVAGRAVIEHDAGPRGAGTHSERLDLGGLAPGVYLLELRSGSRRETAKFVRQ